MIENFEIIHSIQIGAWEFLVGVSPELEFMCCFCTQDDIAEYYSEAMSSKASIWRSWSFTRQAERTDSGKVQAQRNTPPYPTDMLGREHCFLAAGRR